MKPRDVHLQYSFQPVAQRGAAVQHPLFDVLRAVHAHGSIQRAAQGMGASYRHVWGALKQWQDALGEPLVSWTQGHPARLTPYAERLLQAETLARARLEPHIEALRAELQHVLHEAHDGPRPALTLCAGHDPALLALRDTALREEKLHVELRPGDAVDALRALGLGRCAVAGFALPLSAQGSDDYLRSLRPLLDPARHSVIGGLRRVHGLATAPGNPLGLRTLADVVRQRGRYVQRHAGSATRLLTEQLLAQAALEPGSLQAVHTEDSDAAVAAAVAAGIADAGITTQAVAHAWGLDFVPLAADEVLLACADDALERPAVQALRRALHSPHWHAALAALPGCEPAPAGGVRPLRHALPWSRPARPSPAR